MSALATRTGAINLGQGFPDTDGPTEVAEAAIEAIRTGVNQYPPATGSPALRRAIVDHQQRFWGIELDPDSEVLVTVGATEAVAASILALCEPGDEVVALEPVYDSYPAAVAMAGARLTGIPLAPPRYELDLDRLVEAITPATRLLLLNTPHNPTGRVLRRDEMEAIAAACLANDVLVVTDEVYEHLVFDGPHIPMSTLPGMADRTVTISSAGKTLSFTGWKVGWATGPEPLLSAVRTLKQFLTFVGPAPFQPAVALGLGLPDDFYAELIASLTAKRDRLGAGLTAAGFDVCSPQGTYFTIADSRPLGVDDGTELCRAMPELVGVAAVPVSSFHLDQDRTQPFVRFAFCKRDTVLDEAIERLGELRHRL